MASRSSATLSRETFGGKRDDSGERATVGSAITAAVQALESPARSVGSGSNFIAGIRMPNVSLQLRPGRGLRAKTQSGSLLKAFLLMPTPPRPRNCLSLHG